MERICPYCMNILSEGTSCPACGKDPEAYRPASHHFPPGTRLHDRYVLGRVLGEGGFGITYLAYDTKAERAVAIKEYYPDGTAVRTDDNVTVEPMTSLRHDDYSHGLERFFSEAGIIKKFNGVNDIPEVYDVFRENGTA